MLPEPESFREPRNRFRQHMLPMAESIFLGSLNVYKFGLRCAGTITLFVVPARQATRLAESIPGLLKRLQIRALKENEA
jgi:hypothetical protein